MKKIIRLTENDLNRIVKRVISENESVVDINTLIKKINGILVSTLESELDDYISDIEIKFGFNTQKEFQMYDDMGEILLFDDFSSDWEGGTTNYYQPINYLKEINSANYIDIVEDGLTDEELSTFDQVGTVPKSPNKSLRELMTNGKILLWLRPLGTTNIMTWKRLNVSGSGQGETTACMGVNAKYNNLGDSVKATDILFKSGEPVTKSKKICNGGTLISNSGLGIGFFKPINDIINSNK